MLEHWQSLVLTVFIFLCVGYGLYQTMIRKKTPHIRRLPAIEAIDEGIGRCVETGRAVHSGLPEARLVGEVVAETLTGVSLVGYFAKKAAAAGTRAFYTVSEPNTLVVMESTIRDSYVSAGKLEDFNNADMVQVRMFTGTYPLALPSLLQRENVGASLITGSIGKSCLQIGEAHREADTFAILAHAAWDKLEWAVATFDYVLILQETYAAGAWITGEPAQLGSVIGVDLVSWSMFILQLLLVGAATALGTMLTSLTG